MGTCCSSRRELCYHEESSMERPEIIEATNETKENVPKETPTINTISTQNLMVEKINLEEDFINNNINDYYKSKDEFNNIQTNNYYLKCPDCLVRSPHIEKLYYDKNLKDFLVKYTCICMDNTLYPKETALVNILSNKEPLNTCNIHVNNKLINYCKTCKKNICSICKENQHKYHNLENDNIYNPMSREDENNLLEIIKEKKNKFNNKNNNNMKTIENGFVYKTKKFNKRKINYKNKIKNYKDSHKTISCYKNKHERYISNFDNTSETNNYIYNNKDILLSNQIHNFAKKTNDITKISSSKNKNIHFKLNYNYPVRNGYTIDVDKSKISQQIFPDLKEKDFTCKKTILGHTQKIVCLIELISGKIASGSYDKTIRIWDLNTEKEDLIIKEKGRVFCLLEFEKNKILSGISDNSITLWDADSPCENYIYNFTGHELWVNSLVKCDNKHFASASNDTKIKIWDFYNKKCTVTLKGHLDSVLTLILLKNKHLCSGGADLTIKIWDWEEQNCLSTLKGHEKWVKCILELNNGIIVSGSDDSTIKIWQNYIHIKTLRKHTHSVRTFCQINNYYFASGSFDCTIKIWAINTWICIQSFIGHSLNIICIISLENKNKYNDSYNYMASCSNDKTIKIWEGSI